MPPVACVAAQTWVRQKKLLLSLKLRLRVASLSQQVPVLQNTSPFLSATPAPPYATRRVIVSAALGPRTHISVSRGGNPDSLPGCAARACCNLVSLTMRPDSAYRASGCAIFGRRWPGLVTQLFFLLVCGDTTHFCRADVAGLTPTASRTVMCTARTTWRAGGRVTQLLRVRAGSRLYGEKLFLFAQVRPARRLLRRWFRRALGRRGGQGGIEV